MNPRIIALVLQLKNSVVPVIPLLQEIHLLLIEDDQQEAADEIAQAIGYLSSATFSLNAVAFMNLKTKEAL